MAEVIRMPRMSDTMEEGNIVGWLKKVGDEVESGDILAEVETDKAVMELETYSDGFLLYIGVEEGAVPVNSVIAVIGEEGEDYEAALKEAEAEDGGGSAPAAESKDSTPKEDTPAPVEAEVVSVDDKVKASPLAKSMAKDAGIDISTIAGSGENGRVVKKDVEAAIAAPAAAPAPAATSAAAPAAKPAPPKDPVVAFQAFNSGDVSEAPEVVPVSSMRKVIAKRLAESKFSAPHFYLKAEIDMTNVWNDRKTINAVSPVKISFNDIITKAVAIALKQHPSINSYWLEDKIQYNKDVHVGIAVAIEDGLVVPVVKHTNLKTLSQLSVEIKDLAKKAKGKKLGAKEMSGGTFTISNLGMFDIEEFTAIINPPESCILAVGGIKERPVIKDGEVAAARMMKVSLSCDHRTVDGAMGAAFLQTLKTLLENPVTLLV